MRQAFLLRFQSLIGRLGTVLISAVTLPVHGFQSLIGRLGTVIVLFFLIIFYQFQSLIGRLGTMSKSAMIRELYDVSIPHR